jgi:hypothetical protein
MRAILLVALAVPHSASVLAGGRSLPTAADAFGYERLADGAPHCPYQWIDTSTGTPFLFAPSDTDPATDDGWADLALAQPFVFYDRSHAALRVSTNGYLAFALPGFPEDDGGYWRSDCPLPAIPDNPEAAFARVYALGGDLEAGSGGVARAQHFSVCPRPPSYGSDACTVIEWDNWQRKHASGTLNAQVVLYHARREILIQYGMVAPAAAAGLTAGIQSHGADSGIAACGSEPAVVSMGGWCFFHPLFPAGQPPPPNVDLIFADGFEAWPP